MVLWVACPSAGVGAFQGAAVPVTDLIPGEQEVEAPCQEEQEGAWASEAYLCNTNNKVYRHARAGKMYIQTNRIHCITTVIYGAIKRRVNN